MARNVEDLKLKVWKYKEKGVELIESSLLFPAGIGTIAVDRMLRKLLYARGFTSTRCCIKLHHA